ncbi:ABC-F family ATP-binding cassette domain-containing protein [Dolosicoccus paucivorans]|uniref:ABC-F family ATP-binding cassette domain-containing protein n=1 Tax=Dolosicoccus paucivorans TaxID=84521 RepID=UPI0008870528|nr:ABC-F family ATP-binding cassette domain-containing protein [Dolosicoccus paucivorans]SDI26545.1 ATP-binding cassette, subfamily F, uup [Dolosicoccus paucivorans]
MKELAIEQLYKTYGVKKLAEGVDLSIKTGDRIGLIGPNGTGKSSLLKVIAGLEGYDSGQILKPNDYTISYLDQNPVFDPDKTILETIYDSPAPLVQLVLRYETIRLQLEDNPQDEALQQSFMRMSEEMSEKGGWDVETKARTILSQLGLTQLNQTLGESSGGQRKRVGIAQALIASSDLLILDEPTNHLDVDSIQWLERYLSNYPGAVLLVTHDRYFLDRVVNQIVELRHGKLTYYKGAYQDYLEQRAEREALQARMQEKEDRLFTQELAWMRTGARARTTKQQARIDRFESLKENIQSRDQQDRDIELDFSQQRIGNQVMELEDVTVEIGGKTVVKDLTHVFVKGDRVGIIGDNGVGKTTFLNVLAERYPVSNGVYKVGQTVRFAYYRQLDEDLPGDKRILEYLSDVADNFKRPDGTTASAAQMLERFNFDRHSHGVTIDTLSGGEKRRLYLLSLLIQEPNVLLLDEPTNDLDIDTLTILESYLEDFKGVVVVVSHDRYFLDKTVHQLLDIKGHGEFEWYWGSYTEYLETVKTMTSKPKPVKEATAVEKVNEEPKEDKPRRMTYHEKKEWAELPDLIEKYETMLDDISNKMNESGSDAGKLMELQEQLEATEMSLMEAYERYEFLEQLSM